MVVMKVFDKNINDIVEQKLVSTKITLIELCLLTKKELTDLLKTNEEMENYEGCILINKVLKNKDEIDKYLTIGGKKIYAEAICEINKIINKNEKK